MSTTATTPARTTTPQTSSPNTDDLVHWESCCYPGEALCGFDLTGHQETDRDVTCVACAHLGNSGLSCFHIRARRLN